MFLGPVDFGEHRVELAGDGYEGDSTASFGVGRAQVGEPPVVCLGAGHPELGVEVARQPEPRAERYARAALDRVGIGVDDLGRDTVRVERLIALDAVPAAGQLFLVILEPLLRELRVAHAELRDCFEHCGAFGQEVLELWVVLLLEVLAVVSRGQPGVRVRGDDQVRIVVVCHGFPPERLRHTVTGRARRVNAWHCYVVTGKFA